jgi:flagellar motor component MotA
MKYFDMGSIIVIVITFVLFAMALFFTGFTHDLLLEAGVFLVSVKLIIMAYKTSVSSRDIHRELEEIKNLLKNIKENT